MRNHSRHILSVAALSMAVLTATTNASEGYGFAALSLETGSDGWCQLLPAGKFKAVDGRPEDTEDGYWHLDQATGDQLIAQLKAMKNNLVIDYEHQTLLSDQNGKPAPASGWVEDAEWRESGLWIKPKWTANAQNYISGGEYAYLSAVFPYGKDGKPLSLHSAALTNRAGLDGMQKVALSALKQTDFPAGQQSTSTKDSDMNELLKKLLAALGLKEDSTDEEALAAVKALKDGAATDEQKGAMAELAALKSGGTGDPDPEKFVPMSVYKDLQTQMAALSVSSQANEADTLIAKAKTEGRITAANEDYAKRLGKKNVAALKTFIDNSTPIAALVSMQVGKDTPEDKDKTGVHGLSDEEIQVAKLTGRTPEQFAALKAAETSTNT